MKLSKKTNLYFMLFVYLFAYYSMILTLSLISELIESSDGRVIITGSKLFGRSIVPLFLWGYILLGGKLTEKINRDYDEKNYR